MSLFTLMPYTHVDADRAATEKIAIRRPAAAAP